MPVAAPADKRFRRAHVSPARRATLRDAWPKLLGVIVVCCALITGVYFATERVLSAGSLTISNITVSGNARIARGEVVALLEGLRGQNMLSADLESWRMKLLESPWVADAAIRRVFPGTVSVAISERQPLGIGRINNSLYLIDRRGVVIDEYGPNYAEFDLPVIDGLAAHAPTDGTLVDEERAVLAGRLLSELAERPELAKLVSQIDVSNADDAVLLLKNDTAFVRLGTGNFVERLQAYLDLASTLRERIPDIDYVDLRFDQRVFVRPQGNGSKAQKGTGG